MCVPRTAPDHAEPEKLFYVRSPGFISTFPDLSARAERFFMYVPLVFLLRSLIMVHRPGKFFCVRSFCSFSIAFLCRFPPRAQSTICSFRKGFPLYLPQKGPKWGLHVGKTVLPKAHGAEEGPIIFMFCLRGRMGKHHRTFIQSQVLCHSTHSENKSAHKGTVGSKSRALHRAL